MEKTHAKVILKGKDDLTITNIQNKFLYLVVEGARWPVSVEETSVVLIQKSHYDKLRANIGELGFVQDWAYTMGLMLEDCTYMNLSTFDKDAKAHLATLIERVGKWIPPEMRKIKDEG